MSSTSFVSSSSSSFRFSSSFSFLALRLFSLLFCSGAGVLLSPNLVLGLGLNLCLGVNRVVLEVGSFFSLGSSGFTWVRGLVRIKGEGRFWFLWRNLCLKDWRGGDDGGGGGGGTGASISWLGSSSTLAAISTRGTFLMMGSLSTRDSLSSSMIAVGDGGGTSSPATVAASNSSCWASRGDTPQSRTHS